MLYVYVSSLMRHWFNNEISHLIRLTRRYISVGSPTDQLVSQVLFLLFVTGRSRLMLNIRNPISR